MKLERFVPCREFCIRAKGTSVRVTARSDQQAYATAWHTQPTNRSIDWVRNCLATVHFETSCHNSESKVVAGCVILTPGGNKKLFSAWMCLD